MHTPHTVKAEADSVMLSVRLCVCVWWQLAFTLNYDVKATTYKYNPNQIGVLATERDSVSTYSRNYKHKRERLPSSNTRGGRPKRSGPTQGGKTRLCMR